MTGMDSNMTVFHIHVPVMAQFMTVFALHMTLLDKTKTVFATNAAIVSQICLDLPNITLFR